MKNNVIHINFRNPNRRTKTKPTRITKLQLLRKFFTTTYFSDILMTTFVILMCLVFVGLGVLTLLVSIK